MNARVNDFARMIEREAGANGDFPVLTFVHVEPDGTLAEEVRDYAALWANGRRLAQWLQSQGIGKGDSVLLLMRNYPQLVEAMVATALLGAVLVPVDPRSMGEKLGFMIGHVGARVILAEAQVLPAIEAVAGNVAASLTVLVIDGPASRAASPVRVAHMAEVMELDGNSLVEVMPDPASTMYLLFTSGTTGNPKAVVRTHAHYMKSMKGLRALGVEPGDVLYTGLPLCHTNAHTTLAAGIAMGLRTVISRQFTKSRLWDICRAYGCTVFTLLGGMIPEVYAAPARADDADNPVRFIISSGMPAELRVQYEQRFGVLVTEVYGSTENAGSLINRLSEGPPGSMGKPPPGMIAAILDDQDQPCAPYQPGNLCFRPDNGEGATMEYFANPTASAEKTAGGWFRTGDIAYTDENGWFFFQHRVGGGVRRNGDFVNTALVETVLAQCPGVMDAFVYGVGTSRNVAGEKAPVAAVVLAPGFVLSAARDWAAERLQRNELPEIWQVLDAIPKTTSEKPLERECIVLLKEAGLLADYEMASS